MSSPCGSNGTPGSSLLRRRKFSTGLAIENFPKAPCADTECRELDANYRVSDCILGQGTTAVVKSGARIENSQAVAIKEINTYGDEELCEIMRKEFELMKSLQHANIVEVYDFYQSPQLTKAFLCMQLVQGTTLVSCTEQHGRISEATMRPLFKQLVSALAYLHCKRITHRDLKPDNILVENSMDKLFICDFGCARNLAEGGNLTSRVGTMIFAPPEMLLGHATGDQTDIWSVGMCLYFSLAGGATPTTGKVFSSKDSFGQYLACVTSAERKNWITSIGLSIESSLAQVLWGCLNPDPSQRPDAMLLLAHPWVTPEEVCPPLSPLSPLSPSVSHRLPPSPLPPSSNPVHAQNSTKNGARSAYVKKSQKQTTSANDAAARSQRLCAYGLGISDTSAEQHSAGTGSGKINETSDDPASPGKIGDDNSFGRRKCRNNTAAPSMQHFCAEQQAEILRDLGLSETDAEQLSGGTPSPQSPSPHGVWAAARERSTGQGPSSPALQPQASPETPSGSRGFVNDSQNPGLQHGQEVAPLQSRRRKSRSHTLDPSPFLSSDVEQLSASSQASTGTNSPPSSPKLTPNADFRTRARTRGYNETIADSLSLSDFFLSRRPDTKEIKQVASSLVDKDDEFLFTCAKEESPFDSHPARGYVPKKNRDSIRRPVLEAS